MKTGYIANPRLCASGIIACLLAVTLLPGVVSAKETESVSDMTGPWQLFVDDYLVSDQNHVARTFHPFEKHPSNPVVRPDKPWEKDSLKCSMVLPNEDGPGFRMWYSTKAPKKDPDKGHSLYATSKDGITWEKPNLGFFPWKVDGSTENNFVGVTGIVVHTPWKEPDAQYTILSFGSYKGTLSPDGFHAGQRSDGSLITGGGDVGRFQWDPHTGEYRGFVKISRKVSGLRRRSLGFSKSDNVLKPWPPLRLALAPDEYDDRWVEEEGSVLRTHFYGMTPFSYETIYVGFLWIFRASGDDEGYFFGPLYTEIITSRDGIHWRRQDPPRVPMIPVGAPGAWDDGMVAGAALVVDGDQLKAYYSGYDDTHDIVPMHSSIGLGTMRKDGFASLDAAAEMGGVTTKRLAGAGGPLKVNYHAPGGWLKVEVLDEKGAVLPGYGLEDCVFLRGDSVDRQVTWDEHDELPAGHGSLRLRFSMQNASLYSFMAGEKIEVVEDPAEPVLAALYTCENNEPLRKHVSVTDQLTADGLQTTTLFGTTSRGIYLDGKPENAAFGNNSLQFLASFTPRCTVEIGGTSELGKYFTLAVMAKSADNKHARLFSSYDDFGPCKGSELVFDCDPTGTAVAGLRLICQGMIVESKPLNFADGKYHHLAVVYDNGEVIFYLDGQEAGRDWIGGDAPVSMQRNLYVGEDSKHGHEEQFRGFMDDVLVLGRAMSAEEIKALSRDGAEAFFKDRQDLP